MAEEAKGAKGDQSERVCYPAHMRIPGHPRIDVDPAICGGRPRVGDTRMRVLDILAMMAGGATEAEILEDFDYATAEDVRACLAFAATYLDHPIILADAAE